MSAWTPVSFFISVTMRFFFSHFLHILSLGFPQFQKVFLISPVCGKRIMHTSFHVKFSTLFGFLMKIQAFFCGKTCGNCGKPFTLLMHECICIFLFWIQNPILHVEKLLFDKTFCNRLFRLVWKCSVTMADVKFGSFFSLIRIECWKAERRR